MASVYAAFVAALFAVFVAPALFAAFMVSMFAAFVAALFASCLVALFLARCLRFDARAFYLTCAQTYFNATYICGLDQFTALNGSNIVIIPLFMIS